MGHIVGPEGVDAGVLPPDLLMVTNDVDENARCFFLHLKRSHSSCGKAIVIFIPVS